MNPVNFKEANITYGKPEGWEEDECGNLPVHKGSDGKHPVLVSAWMPSIGDIERMVEGKPIYLTIVGTAMPPVSLSTESPFPEEEEKVQIELKHEKEVAPEYTFKFVEFDKFGRAIFKMQGMNIASTRGKDKKATPVKLVDVDGILNTMSADGEPQAPTKMVTPTHLIPER